MNSRDEVVATLARERWGALVGYAYLLTGSIGDAEDLVQDALVKVVVRGAATARTSRLWRPMCGGP